MKLTTTIIFTFLFVSSFAQPDIEGLYDYADKEDNQSNCFFTAPLDTNNAERLYLQIIPPEYEVYQVKINDDLIKSKSVDLSRSDLSVSVGEISTRILLRVKYRHCMSVQEYETGKFFCIVEIPPNSYQFELDTIIKNSDTTYSVKEKVVDARKLIKPSEIKIYQSKEKVDSELPIYEILGGEWSEYKNIYCTGGCRIHDLVKKLQIGLIENGYDLEFTEVIDITTKNALIDYQKKNNLPEGRLDGETLRMLKVIPKEKY